MSMTAASARNKKHGQTASKERQNDPIDCGSTSAIVQPIQVLQVQPQKQRTQQSQCATPSTTAHSSSSSVYTGLHPTRPHKDNDVTSVYFQRGQCIRPQSVAESSIVGSMAELVREVIPQSSKPTSPQAEAEHIDWVSFQKCPKGSDQRRIANIVVLGLLRGYQIWIVKENGECEEVLSEKKGPLRTGHILPANPEASFGIHKDRFESDRPLFAMVPVDPDCSHSTVSFLSLKSAKIVHSLTYPDPICRLDASTKIFVMSFTDCIVILDAMSLTQQRCIFDCLAVDGLYCPLALSDIFIAFGDREFHQMNQSSGGMVSAEETSSLPSSYSSSMLSAVKSLSKTVSAVGEAMMLRSSLSSSPQSKQLINSLTHPGIVTVVDATKLPTENDDIEETGEHVLAHFVAHDEPIGYMDFSPSGQMLLTSGQSATVFNVFILYPHARCPSLGAVCHAYTLQRGATPAKVLATAFSLDNRWVAISTNHGTTHVFAISPYGGPVNKRTHIGSLVNKESSYFRSAGLSHSQAFPVNRSFETKSHQFGAPHVYKNSPFLENIAIARSVSNPSLGPFGNPHALFAVGKIRQRLLSVDSISARANDMTSRSSGKSLCTDIHMKYAEHHRLAVSFACNPVCGKTTSLLVLGTDGVLTEYELEVSAQVFPSSTLPSSTTTATPRISDEAPIQCRLTATAHWKLQRTKSSPDIAGPRPDSNTLLKWLSKEDEKVLIEETDEESGSEANWIGQVEVLTYLEPFRRLWTGPQFKFKTYVSTDHSSALLHTPGESGDGSWPVVKTVPVMIEAVSSLRTYDMEKEATRVVPGSWSSDTEYRSCDENYDMVRERIEQAMKEMPFGGFSSESNKGANEKPPSEASGTSSPSIRSERMSDRDNISLQFSGIDM